MCKIKMSVQYVWFGETTVVHCDNNTKQLEPIIYQYSNCCNHERIQTLG